jgi:hypothetical protein
MQRRHRSSEVMWDLFGGLLVLDEDVWMATQRLPWEDNRIHARYLKERGNHVEHAASRCECVTFALVEVTITTPTRLSRPVLFIPSLIAVLTPWFVLYALNFFSWPLTRLPITMKAVVSNGPCSLQFSLLLLLSLCSCSFLSCVCLVVHT